MGDMPDFDRGQVIGAHLAGVSVKNCLIIRYIESDRICGYVSIHK